MKRIVLAGGTGFLGRALAGYFARRQWDVLILTRAPGGPGETGWDARTPGAWARELEGASAVINLTGRSVNCRYHARNRREILESRVDSTRVIGRAMAACKRPPGAWLNASTATIYQHTFGPAWEEDGEIASHPDAHDAFSIEVARAWERELFEAPAPATRRVALRAAMVLGPGANSVFPVLRRLVRSGLGGRQGSGEQFVSWIHQTDFCRAVEWILAHEALAGPVNVCAPGPLRNREMMRTLRELMGMPFGLPASRWMLELGAIFLRTETELVLKSRRVVPGCLKNSGFSFRYETFEAAARALLDSRAGVAHPEDHHRPGRSQSA